MAPRAAAAKANEKVQANVAKKRGREDEVAQPAKRPKVARAAADKEKEKGKKAAPAKKAAAPAKKAAAAAKKPAAKKPATKKPVEEPVHINTAPTTLRHIYVFGEGSAGELGLGAGKGVTNVKRPRLNQLIDKFGGVVDLAVGGMHCIALTKDNEILTWGVNDNKALGRILPEWAAREVADPETSGSDSDSDEDEGEDLNPHEATPTAIPADSFPPNTIFTQVAAGDSTSYVVTSTGDLYGWGTYRNAEGIWGFSLTASGSIIKEQPVPLLIPGLKNIVSVSCGDNHTLALDVDGKVYAWGVGQQDQLGRRIVARHADKFLTPSLTMFGHKKSTKIAKIIAGPNHNFAIQDDGTLWSWGLNNFCQTGIPYGEHEMGDGSSATITLPAKVANLKEYNIIDVGVGSNHSIALTADGDLLSFGRLENWALGFDFKAQANQAIVDDRSRVRKNDAGKPKIMLLPYKITNFPPPANASAASSSSSDASSSSKTNATAIPKFSFIACGPDHNIAITTAGKAWAWGFNANLQLGVGRDDDEVRTPEMLVSKWINDQQLDWAGCGGQFSVVAGVGDDAEGKGKGKK